MKHKKLVLIIFGTTFLTFGFQHCTPLKSGGSRNSASAFESENAPPPLPTDSTEITEQNATAIQYSLATTSSSSGVVVKLMADGVEANLNLIDWYMNGEFDSSSTRLTLSSTELAGFSTCKYSVKAVFADASGQKERSASFNVNGCVVAAAEPVNLAGCPANWKSSSTASALTWTGEFGGIPFADIGSNAYGGGIVKLYDMSKTTPISFKINSDSEGGSFSTVDSSGMFYIRWAVSISGSACPGYIDSTYSSPCSSKYGVKWVRADLAALYPDRCALVPGKTYYLNMRVYSPVQNNTYCTNASGIELDTLGWAAGKCAITASGINKAALPRP